MALGFPSRPEEFCSSSYRLPMMGVCREKSREAYIVLSHPQSLVCGSVSQQQPRAAYLMKMYRSSVLHGGSFPWCSRTYSKPFCFPVGSDGKESASLQCGRLRFDPWVGKIPWRREWLPTPVFLPGEFHGKRSLASYSPWGCKETQPSDLTHKPFCIFNTFPPSWAAENKSNCLFLNTRQKWL